MSRHTDLQNLAEMLRFTIRRESTRAGLDALEAAHAALMKHPLLDPAMDARPPLEGDWP